ncbi:MAG: OmpA family protein [Fluviicola sp.]|nr:OmpA family protein [Fluviicola sp.]
MFKIHYAIASLGLFIACFIVSFGYAQTPPLTVSVYFDTDQHTLTPDSRKTLDALIRNLDTVQGATMYLSGHTDSRADQTYNDQLSERRIASVQEYLFQNAKTPLPTVVDRKAQGENNPIDDNQTATGMARNRRVDIEIRTPLEVISPEVVIAKPTDSIQELYRLLNELPENYTIDNRYDTLLMCEKGTVLSIPAYCLVKPKQSNYLVTLSIRETIELSDMLLGNLNTMAGNELLETGGMVEIDASDQLGNKLNLLKEKSMTVYLPTDSIQPDFQPFYGTRNSTPQATVNWRPEDFGHGMPLQGYVGIPWNYWTNCWNPMQGTARCKFFFCRINRLDETIKGGFNRSQRASNYQFRSEQKRLRKGAKRWNSSACLAYGSLYQLTPPDTATFLALNKAYMKKHNLKTVDETLLFMRKQQDSLMAIRSEINQLSYNALSVTSLGMINCDRFTKGQSKTTLATTTPYAANIDAKMIFTDIKSILPANTDSKGNFSFNSIPKGKKVWIVFLKVENKQAYMSIQEIKTGGNKTITPDFKAVTTEEVKRAFLKFNS